MAKKRMRPSGRTMVTNRTMPRTQRILVSSAFDMVSTPQGRSSARRQRLAEQGALLANELHVMVEMLNIVLDPVGERQRAAFRVNTLPHERVVGKASQDVGGQEAVQSKDLTRLGGVGRLVEETLREERLVVRQELRIL